MAARKKVDVEVRALASKDVKALIALWPRVPWLSEREAPTARKLISQPTTVVLGAFEGDSLIGYTSAVHTVYAAFLDDVVAPDLEDTDVPVQLLEALCSELGERDLHLYCRPESAGALRDAGFMERVGYVVMMRPWH